MSDYWKGRFDQIEQAANNKSVKHIRQLEKKYQKATQEIDTKINAWYSRIAKNNEVSMTEARRLLTSSELREFKWTVQDYIKAGQENALDQRWMKELENASAKFHISRLEALKLEIRHQIEQALAGGQEDMYGVLADVYSDTFYHSCFEVQKGIGVGFDVSKLDDKQVSKLINKPWSVTGENFSTNVWKNKTKLINTLDQELTRMILTGETPQKAIQNIKKAMNTSLSNAKRLVLTEQAYFTSLAQKDAYAELDVEEYEIVSTLDNRTCSDCGEFDGKHFSMNEMSPGVNAPPFHPYCRCTTCPYYDDEFTIGERIAKDEDGNYYEVPEKMTYEEWKEAFVDGGSKDDFKEESLRTKSGGTYGVDWSIVKSKEYTEKFEALSNNHEANMLAAQRSRNALSNRTGKNTEELYAISLTTGKDVSSIVDQHNAFGVKRTKKFTDDVKRAEANGERLLFIHNHPKGLTPSIVDINELLDHKNASGITVGHNGSIYYYSKPTKKITDFDFVVAFRKKKEYNGVKQYEKAMEELAKQFGFVFKIL